jgi:hypothetical protein
MLFHVMFSLLRRQQCSANPSGERKTHTAASAEESRVPQTKTF